MYWWVSLFILTNILIRKFLNFLCGFLKQSWLSNSTSRSQEPRKTKSAFWFIWSQEAKSGKTGIDWRWHQALIADLSAHWIFISTIKFDSGRTLPSQWKNQTATWADETYQREKQRSNSPTFGFGSIFSAWSGNCFKEPSCWHEWTFACWSILSFSLQSCK